ncbi:MAG: ABC transporter substrate-binding protein [Acidimicrobiaceae bacterium]|nr:ABC transporter substrate-binding protein [Acidimicrobiaceae bacterium]
MNRQHGEATTRTGIGKSPITVRGVRLLVGLFAIFALVAAAGGDDDAPEAAAPATTAAPTTTAAPAEETPEPDDIAMDPVRIGFDSQEEELFSIIEARRAAEAAVAYINAELGGVDGHPLELELCTSGDGPEGAVACAQQFANDDDIHVMITSSYSSNEAAEVTVPAGLPQLALANLPDDWQRPTEWIFDPGFLGLVQGPVAYAADAIGANTMTIICLDDPFFLEACDAASVFAENAGLEVTGITPAAFEQADYVGVVTASGAADVDVVMAAIDGTQCSPLADALSSLSVETAIITFDTCALEDTVASGALDGWLVFGASALPVDPSLASDAVLEGQRIIEAYGSEEAEVYGLAGWALVSVLGVHAALVDVGYENLSRETVNEALSRVQLTTGYYADVSCPGPDPFPGACVSSLIVLEVDGTSMKDVGLAPIDFSEFEALG